MTYSSYAFKGTHISLACLLNKTGFPRKSRQLTKGNNSNEDTFGVREKTSLLTFGVWSKQIDKDHGICVSTFCKVAPIKCYAINKDKK